MSYNDEAVRVRAPGKINLELAIGPPDDRGYHPLATVYQAVSRYEEVTARPGEPGSGITISVTGRDAELVPTGSENIAHRAALMLARHAGIVADDAEPDVRLEITKDVPVGGGMGGGSADAAATLIACDHLWRAALSREDLDELAAELGADVTFALHGGTAIGTGYGEQLTPALARGRFHWVLALSDEPISTARAYRALDELDRDPPAEPAVDSNLMAALRAGDATTLGLFLRNDLQEVALAMQPKLRKILAAALHYGAAGVIVSGSGPTVAVLTHSLHDSLQIASEIRRTGLASETLLAEGPVPGARILEPVRSR